MLLWDAASKHVFGVGLCPRLEYPLVKEEAAVFGSSIPQLGKINSEMQTNQFLENHHAE